MSRRLILLFSLVLSFYCSQAQLNQEATDSPAEDLTVLPAKLFTQLATAIKPSALVSATAKDEKTLITNASDQNDPGVVAKNVATLAGFIKPEMFSIGFNPQTLKSKAASVKTTAQAANILGELESGLKPSALMDIWKMQRSGWESGLKKLK